LILPARLPVDALKALPASLLGNWSGIQLGSGVMVVPLAVDRGFGGGMDGRVCMSVSATQQLRSTRKVT